MMLYGQSQKQPAPEDVFLTSGDTSWKWGTSPSSTPVTKTQGNSSPFAAWNVISRTHPVSSTLAAFGSNISTCWEIRKWKQRVAHQNSKSSVFVVVLHLARLLWDILPHACTPSQNWCAILYEYTRAPHTCAVTESKQLMQHFGIDWYSHIIVPPTPASVLKSNNKLLPCQSLLGLSCRQHIYQAYQMHLSASENRFHHLRFSAMRFYRSGVCWLNTTCDWPC